MNARFSVLIVGNGSIGRRHLENLRTLGVARLSVFTTGLGQTPPTFPDGVAVYRDFDEALESRPDAVVVANPTSLHAAAALAAARSGCALLIEKPVSHTTAGLDVLRAEVESRAIPVLVGYQFRFHPGLTAVRAWIRGGRLGDLIGLHAHWGEYLPDWHPGEDYRKGYSARSDLGGGVALTLSHPLDYLRWLAGEAETVRGISARRGGLEIDVDDAAVFNLRFKGGAVGTVSLNYVERPGTHVLRVVGTKGRADWNAETGVAVAVNSESGAKVIFRPSPGFGRNTMFLDEMTHFLDCVGRRAEPVCSLGDGIRALEMALTANRGNTDRGGE